MKYITEKMQHIRDVLKWKGYTDHQTEDFLYTGHGLMSMLLPNDFEFTFHPNKVEIVRGVMLSGTLNKSTLGDSHSSIVHKLEKDYGTKVTVDFVSYYQFIVNHCLKLRGFSIGIEDCIPTRIQDVKEEISKSFMEAQIIETSEADEDLRERKINNTLNNATAIGQKISKDELQFDNSLNVMVVAGSKGSYVNIAQIRSLLGQQNVDGKRIPTTYGGRTLPHYSRESGKVLPSTATNEEEDYERRLLYESRGFVTHCFMEGLTPQEFFFHAEGGREGVIDTAIKTAQSGYIQRKLVKKMEDLVKSYSDGLVVNSKNVVVQFNYQNNFDPARLVRVGDKMSFINIKTTVDHLNTEAEWENRK
jgi:DNA-directed RNA polymerase II subunit RPB1